MACLRSKHVAGVALYAGTKGVNSGESPDWVHFDHEHVRHSFKRNALTKRIGPLSIPVASIDDLIRLKTGTGRSKDVVDIEELRKIKQQLAEG